MNDITRDFVKSIGGKCNDTVSVYLNGKFFARYSRAIGLEVCDDLRGNVEVVDDTTGEILKIKEVSI